MFRMTNLAIKSQSNFFRFSLIAIFAAVTIAACGGGGGTSGTASTPAATPTDDVPNQFTLTDQTGVARNASITSAAITIAGIDKASAISISGAGATYSIAGGAYTASSGTVTNGQAVTVRHTSSQLASTAVNSTLTIGTISDTFTSTTAAQVAGLEVSKEIDPVQLQ
tara:strand:- start:5252 stop:5752 length:501 start_codon:yes stop_codon:yes gene_type:complete